MSGEWALRVYRLLLHLYPAQFRQEYEREILLTWRREWQRESGPAGRVWLLARACAGVLANAPQEHFHMLINDLKYALRTFRRSAGFTVVAVATLALGIGVNSALFSVVKAVLLDSLPYKKPDQLARIWVRNPQQGYEHDVTNWPRLEDWRTRSASWQGVAGFTGARLILTGAGEPLQLQGAAVTANFLRVMGVAPFIGRDFDDIDEQQGRARKVILSQGFWRRRFGGDPGIVGRQLTLSGETFQVAGVMPSGFQYPERALDFWTPLALDARTRANRGNYWLNAFGRLKDGVTLKSAQAEMNTLAAALAAQHPQDRHLGVALVSLKEDLTGEIAPALLVLTGAVLFILLICCANIAGMLLAHAAGRGQELAIRSALGAGRSRVVRQLLTEAALLFCAGGAAGIALAYAGVKLLLRLAPPNLDQLRDARLDFPIAAITLVVSAAAGLLCGLRPALAASRLDVAGGLRQGGQRSGGRMDSRRFRSLLTVGETALAMILLTGSWMLVRSLQRIEGVRLGFDTQGITVSKFQLPRARYADAKATVAFYGQLVDRLQTQPGIEGAAAISTLLLGSLPDSVTFYIEGRRDKILTPLTNDTVTPEFFSFARIPLLRGRFFDTRDRVDSPPVTLINETAARRFWPNEDPIGKRLSFGDPDAAGAQWMTIVGVVADTARAGAGQRVYTESYQPLTQAPNRSMELLIRCRRGPGPARAALGAALHDLDPLQPVARFETLDDALGTRVAARRFTTLLLTIFAAAALLIAGVGIYGLISHLVTLRRREFGVRMALGARPADVLWIVATRVAALGVVGLVIGALGTLALSRALNSLLFGVTRFDPASYLAAGAGLMLVCVAAAIAPALRAVRSDPLSALRSE